MRRSAPGLLWTSFAVGLAYGLCTRILFHADPSGFLPIMSIAYLFGVPLAIGFAQVYVNETNGRRSWAERVVLPWLPAALALAGALLLAWEGLICIIVIAPVMLVMASLGGICAGLVRDFLQPGTRHSLFFCCLVLPVVLAPMEQLRVPPRQIREVHTAIQIHASTASIWNEIKSVPLIRAAEQPPGWIYRIGFPRPLEATLDREGAGGIRHARFERGVLFVETIMRWDPPRDLAFSIHADTTSIPRATLDEHVTVGGPYFDVLEGEYTIEQKTDGLAVLHLRSRHRLSTRFNAYAALWTDAIMRNIQEGILQVIRRRAEKPFST